jgi:hypothetical protein
MNKEKGLKAPKKKQDKYFGSDILVSMYKLLVVS